RSPREVQPVPETSSVAHLYRDALAVDRVGDPQPRAERVLVVGGRGRVVHVEDLTVRHAVALGAGAVPAGVALVSRGGAGSEQHSSAQGNYYSTEHPSARLPEGLASRQLQSSVGRRR